VIGDGGGCDTEKLSNGTVCGCRGETSLPFFTSDTSPMLSSSSDSAISKEVRGDSVWVWCGGSNSDCRDIDEVSVLLLLSN
jgi:hypothetical protein